MGEYIGGKHAVIEALRAGREIHKVFVSLQAQPHLTQPIMQAAKAAGIVVQKVDKKKLDQMAEGIQHQGVIAQVASAEYIELEDLMEQIREKEAPAFLLILNELEDPHNLGSILRTAECTGVDGIIIPKRRSVGLTATVAKTSVGAVEYVPVARVSNLAQTMEKLKEAGIWIVGADGSADQEVYDVDLKIPIAIVIGNEHKGMNRIVREGCDFVAKLPMYGKINSLNASVAAGLFMYEVVRQRYGKG
ncbi:23S rRNA (guanosine(2251)-2'-O)-methyltransferase RlmB [Marinicrinis lubricantis]|uniref:23S rRNA (Guanosine(2251)-2'-O)-methyltransferase RlmB n=1 Tax=Marinicrinis lubricantis TaxID=2086470 RepID=A0ABW1ISC5_9BACL